MYRALLDVLRFILGEAAKACCIKDVSHVRMHILNSFAEIYETLEEI